MNLIYNFQPPPQTPYRKILVIYWSSDHYADVDANCRNHSLMAELSQ